MNEGLPAAQHRGRLLISKAVILLCLAKKSRDADHLQNFVYDQIVGLDPEELAGELREAEDYVPIPAYAYDCHTREGPEARQDEDRLLQGRAGGAGALPAGVVR